MLRAAGAGAAVIGTGGLLQACSSSIKGSSSGSGAGGKKTITIGWIHPLTGALAGFGAPDRWVISKIKQTAPYKNGFKVGGKTYQVTIKSYDTQSSPTRAGDLAHQAVLTDGVNLLLASSTPETVNAVASTAESLGTPLVCSNIPWEPWYINLGGNPEKPTVKPKFVVMYFLGAEHLIKAFIPMWDRIHDKLHTGKVVAAAFPNDSDGNAFRAVFPPIAKAAGYKFELSSAYPDGTTNYSSMISQFKSKNADFFTNVPLPPHAAFTSVSDPHDKAEVADAIHKVNIHALAGPLNFASGGPAPGVAITPPVGVQWQKGTKFPLEMQVVDNTLLLVDEVAGGLTDPEVAQLVEIVRGINAEGTAVIWIEHVVRALTPVVSRLICLSGGKFIGDGEPATVLANPAVREVFLGSEVTAALAGGSLEAFQAGDDRSQP